MSQGLSQDSLSPASYMGCVTYCILIGCCRGKLSHFTDEMQLVEMRWIAM